MTRSLLNWTLAVTLAAVCQSAARAGHSASPKTIDSRLAHSNANRLPRTKSNGVTDLRNQPKRSSGKLPQTSQLDQELQSSYAELQSLAARLSRMEKSVESARKAAQSIAKMIKTIDRLEKKVSRIKRQLDSLSKIPQLRVFRPLVKNLEQVRKQVHNLRLKADRVNRETIQPLISRLRKAERKLETKVAEVRQLAGQTQQGRQKLAQLRRFVESRGYKNREVRALESLARPIRPTVRPLRQVVSEINRSLGSADRTLATLASKLAAVSKAQRALGKLDKDLSSADKIAANLDKVLSKKLTIKFPKFSISLRQFLEAPGKLIDLVVKPLEKLARKILAPVLRKAKFKVPVPREVTRLSGQFDKLKSVASGLGSSIANVERSLNRQFPTNYRNKLGGLLRASTSQLTR